MKSDNNKQLITLTVITLSVFHCNIKMPNNDLTSKSIFLYSSSVRMSACRLSPTPTTEQKVWPTKKSWIKLCTKQRPKIANRTAKNFRFLLRSNRSIIFTFWFLKSADFIFNKWDCEIVQNNCKSKKSIKTTALVVSTVSQFKTTVV